MSLIHEALKKVERERQLGQAPTLDSPTFRRRRRRRWPWLLLLLVVAAAAAWHWRGPLQQQVRLALADSPSTASPSVEPAAGKQAADGKEQAAARPDGAAKASKRPAPAAARPGKTTPPARPTRHAPVRQPAKRPARPAANDGQPVLATTPPPAPSKSSAQSRQAGPESSAGPAQPAKNDGPPMYWELPYAQRQNIPEMAISMHMYGARPQDRFVILNGQRMVVGDTLGETGIKLVAVNPDGVTLSQDGHTFQVPRTGTP